MKKLMDNIALIKDQISRLDSSYSVWLIDRPSIFSPKRIGFCKRLRKLLGYEDSKELDELVKTWNRGFSSDITDKWLLEIEVNGRARIARGRTQSEAEKLRSQIADMGGKVMVQQDKDDSAITSERRALESNLRNAEAALKAEQQRVRRAMNEAQKMPDYSAMLSKEELEVIRNFVKEHEVKYYITKEGRLDIFDDVEILADDLDENDELPFAFGRVYGDFDCRETGLSSLKGCPIHVDGDFDCSWNCLESFRGSPRYVGGDFICVENEFDGDFIYDEKDLPDHIGGECTIDVLDDDEE